LVDDGPRVGLVGRELDRDRPLLGYPLAFAAVAAVELATHWLAPYFDLGGRFLFFQAAVVLAAWSGGTGPGLAATALAAVLAGLAPAFFLEPRTILVGGLFLVTGVAVSFLLGSRRGARMRRAALLSSLHRRLGDAAQERKRVGEVSRDLERRLAERNALTLEEQRRRLDAERRRRHAQILAETTRAINESLDVDRMLQRVAVAARDLGDADAARIALRRPGSEALVFRQLVGTRAPGYDLVRLEPGHGLAARLLAGGSPFRSDDVTKDERAQGDPLWPRPEEEIAASLVVPIRVGARVEGLICVDRRTARAFGEEDEADLASLADHLGTAMRNAQLLAGEQSARAEAEAASRAKDEFLAMLGHELRNPLGAISNATRVLHQIGDQASRLQDIIGRQTHHLARLLDDLLDVSRLTTGKIALHGRTIDLQEVVRDSLVALEQEGRTERHDIRVDAEAALVEGDPTRLEQVVRNLLDNAIKYTPPGGHITVTVRRDGDDAVLRVGDTGAGIPHDVLPRIFDLFVQGERSLARSMGGLGIGLTLVKRLVELHGGTVSAWSAGTDQGSEFVVRLPRLVEAAPPAPRGESPEPAPARHVLIVEDNHDAREGLRLLLESWGHRVEEASDGEEGVSRALGGKPDVALIDVGLPGLDGYEVARAIRGGEGGQAIRLVAVTGYGQPEAIQRAHEAGFSAHLVKPLDPDALRRLLAEAG
jgi:signal transduction histidine kinase